jgi:hypothetical protein
MQGLAVNKPRPRPHTDRRPVRDPRRLAVGVDMRSVDGLRFAATYDEVALAFPESVPTRVRDIALLRFAAERAVAAGAWEDVVRLHNLIARKEGSLQMTMRAVRGAAPAFELGTYLETLKEPAP